LIPNYEVDHFRLFIADRDGYANNLVTMNDWDKRNFL